MRKEARWKIRRREECLKMKLYDLIHEAINTVPGDELGISKDYADHAIVIAVLDERLKEVGIIP